MSFLTLDKVKGYSRDRGVAEAASTWLCLPGLPLTLVWEDLGLRGHFAFHLIAMWHGKCLEIIPSVNYPLNQSWVMRLSFLLKAQLNTW